MFTDVYGVLSIAGTVEAAWRLDDKAKAGVVSIDPTHSPCEFIATRSATEAACPVELRAAPPGLRLPDEGDW